MTKSTVLISDFYQKQMEFGYLQSFNLYRNLSGIGSSEYTLKITSCDYPLYEGNQKFLITFLGVRNLKIRDFEGLFKLIITIDDISKDQIEGINYKVIEEEYETFSFICEKFEFEIIQNII
ncbi:hypothetical protein [Paenibacillus periandrae]|uniref:hypothetical protein n=1 Tax=Paenibacillus periandrae TaxID=1761741 RepID=UPI001F099EA8|nr:hypothetical protein [Paenibacillus periandrae]